MVVAVKSIRGKKLMTINDKTRLNLTARWVFPVSGPPVEHGVLEVQGDRITAVHGRDVPHAVDLGNVALIPALINAHAHLEFSDLQKPVQPALPFTEWLRELVAVRRGRPATPEILQRGLAECETTGSIGVGEIATQDWTEAAYTRSNMHVVAFRELLAPTADRIAGQLEIARGWLGQAPSPGSLVRRGLSPHAPYTVHPDLYRDLVQLALDRTAPLAIHLAESTAELELLTDGTGEFVEMLKRFNAWDGNAIPRGSRPLDYLRPLEHVWRALIVHGNYLQSEDLDWLAEHPNVSVIYCPRTHHFFQHSPHPWREMLNRGINVALGTDGRGSNPDLSIWNEMRFLATRHTNIDPAVILSMGTEAGARAMGLDADVGSLAAGMLAAITIVPLGQTTLSDPYRALFASSTSTRLDLSSIATQSES